MLKVDFFEVLKYQSTATIIVDEAGCIDLLSPSAENLFGFASNELIKQPLGTLISKEPSVWEKYLLDPKSMRDAELKGRKKDGTLFPLRITLQRYSLDSHTSTIVFITDLTEEKLQDNAFAKIFYKSPVAKVLTDADNGNIIDVNENFCRLTGYTKTELIGKDSIALGFFSEPAEREKLIAIRKNKGKLENIELTLKTKNKGNIYVLLSVEELEINGNQVVLSTCVDITEKKNIAEDLVRQLTELKELNIAGTRLWRIDNLQEALEEILSYSRKIFNTDKGNVQLLDAEKNVLKIAACHGLSEEFRQYFAEVGADDGSVCARALGERKQIKVEDVEKAEFFAGHLHMARKEGFRAVLSTPLFSTGDSPIGMISVHLAEPGPFDLIRLSMMELYARKAEGYLERHHINESLRKLNQELEVKVKQRTTELTELLEREKQLNDIKSRFVSTASHEFRTPLSTILSSISLLEMRADGNLDETEKKHFERIRSSVKNLVFILDEFLSLDKLEQGKVEEHKETFSLKEFSEGIIEEMSGILKPGQKIIPSYPADVNVVQDRKILRNILLNLFSNAIKYSMEKTEIIYAVKVDAASITFSVKDEGIGIPDEEQHLVFSKFFRAKNTVNTQGTGLGLNIVKKYLELLDGAIEFSSKLNGGSTFTITLPNISGEPENKSS